jgi:2,4-dienoyl-CoA reductase-like NADH-dependent reductase (Old Yellow Enzyme family)
VYRAVRRAVGADFPVTARLGVADAVDGGLALAAVRGPGGAAADQPTASRIAAAMEAGVAAAKSRLPFAKSGRKSVRFRKRRRPRPHRAWRALSLTNSGPHRDHRAHRAQLHASHAPYTPDAPYA